MTLYTYSALTESGNKITGQMEADNVEGVSQSLALKGYIPLDVRRSTRQRGDRLNAIMAGLLSPVRPRDVALFTKQFKTMLVAGVPIINIFQTLETQTENRQLRNAIIEMGRDIKEGSSLHEAFKKHPAIFSPLYCSMLRAGESSGSLVDVVTRLIYIIEHEAKVKADIRSAMFYPAIVVSFLGFAFVMLLMFVIPKFVAIFQRAGIDLPLPTRICLVLYTFLSSAWPYLLVVAVAGGVLLFRYVKTEQGRFVRDTVLLKIPLIGDLVLKGAMSRFASIFSILQYSGVAVLESMSILGDTLGNAVIRRQMANISDRIREGRGISEPLHRAKYFPPMVINMIAIGEESGNLEDMLFQISVHYDSEVEYATKQLADALGPFLTVALAVVVGFFALAIFLPMWDLTKMI
ncbi:MAG: type II secretion system F family protein [Thermodesulfobacteriota bacterium]|nr:type II secretion system F family protein [Thermodesulfobacteriota bacterium]